MREFHRTYLLFEELRTTQWQVIGANGERNHDDKGGKLKKKRTIDDHTMPGSLISTQGQVQKANGKGNHDDNESRLREKRIFNDRVFADKRSTVWTPELHLKFTEATRARPKQILSWMNEPYLTVRQVASHLQKYKLRLKREEKARNSDLAPVSRSSSSRHKAQFPSPSQVFSSGTKEHKRAFDPGLPPAPNTSLNENHNQNQFLENNIGTEESEILSVDQNQPAPEQDDLIKMFVEDCDSFDLFENERNPGDVDQYCEMLRIVLDGNSSRSIYVLAGLTEPSKRSIFGANETFLLCSNSILEDDRCSVCRYLSYEKV
ncbi:Two-component response regulator ARR11, partial [Mucuna pruriens]